ncbi:21793_t:CDS:2, partial [Cetraspora pellucida]
MLYFRFYIFAFLLNFPFTFAAFIPNARWLHSSVLIDNKLYFSGGKINNQSNTTNEFFYLDVSKPFKTTEDVLIPWVDLTYTGGPQKAYVTACIGGKNNDMIFIFGNKPNNNQSFVNQFDTNKQQWINITSSGSVPTDRDQISCAKFNNGLIAIFSGYNYTPIASTNELWIFNTLTLTWNLSSAINAPSSRIYYCAITLPDDNILYLGGTNLTDFSLFMPMNNVNVEINIIDQTWVITLAFTLRPSIAMKNRLWSSFKNPIAIWE